MPTLSELLQAQQQTPSYASNVNNSLGSVVDYYAKQGQAKQELANQIELAKQKAIIENQQKMDSQRAQNEMMMEYAKSNPELFGGNNVGSGTSFSPFLMMPDFKGGMDVKPNPAYEQQKQLNLVEQKQKLVQSNKVKQAVFKEQNKMNELVNNLGVINRDIDSVLDSYKSIPNQFTGPIQGRTLGVMGYWGQMGGKNIKEGTINPATKMPYSKEEINNAKASPIVKYEDTKRFILGNISRALAGEKGVLTQQDIDRIEKALPTKADTEATAAGKIQWIKEFVKSRVDNYRLTAQQNIQSMQQAGATGEDESTEEVDPEYKQYLEAISQIGG